jgi:Squalene-hopene cyclase C-terminal domain
MPLVMAVLCCATPPAAEDRAIAYLSREVPAWSATNKCFSCHNNGNAARALYAASRLGYAVPEKALADTTRWLARPAGWDHNGGDQPFNDRHLARLHFALALREAVDSGRLGDRQPLLDATSAIAARQLADGSWHFDPEDVAASPTNLGPVLATSEIRTLLTRADASRFDGAIRRADAWLRRREAKTVVDAAAVLLALGNATDEQAMSQRRRCLEVVRKGEEKEGGWGPYVNSSPEVFDTALVVLAVSKQPKSAEVATWLRRGRAYLVRTQKENGSWPETTRPAAEESYAERLSTAGWATRALLATR